MFSIEAENDGNSWLFMHFSTKVEWILGAFIRIQNDTEALIYEHQKNQETSAKTSQPRLAKNNATKQRT